MILKKSWFSYVFWGMLTILGTITVLITSTSVVEILKFDSNIAMTGAISGSMILIILFLSMCSSFFSKLRAPSTGTLSSFMEYVFLALICIVSFMARFIYLTFCKGMINGDITFYRSCVTCDFATLFDISPVSYMYGRVLSMFTQIIGDHMVIAMYIDIVLQLAIMLMLFCAVKMLIGKIPAFFAILFYAFFPFNIIDITRVNAETLLAFFFILSVLLIIYSVYMGYEGRLEGTIGIITIVMAGLFSGGTAYLDKSGISLIIFAILVFLIYNNKEQKEQLSSKSVQLFLFFIGAVLGFFVTVMLCIKGSGYGFSEALIKYVFSYTNIKLNILISTPAYGDPYAAVVVIFALVWIFRLFRMDRDLGTPFIVLPFFVAVVSLLGISNQSLISLTTMLWLILASIGLFSLGKHSLELYEKAKLEKEEAERIKKENLEKAKKELEEKKAQLEEKNKAKLAKTEPKHEVQVSVPAQEKVDVKELEATLDFLKSDNDNAENNESSIVKIDTSAIPKPIEQVSLATNTNKTKADEGVDKMTPVSETQKPLPVSSSIPPNQKFGRRMDYKTAVVSKRGHLDLNSNGAPAPKVMSVGTATPLPVNVKKIDEVQVIDTVKVGESKKTSAPIHNPLPTPKKVTNREFEFDIEVTEKDMHFDIVDLTGMDFFDIN